MQYENLSENNLNNKRNTLENGIIKEQIPLRNHVFLGSLPASSTVKAAHSAAHQDPVM